MTGYDRITSYCINLYHFSDSLNMINEHNPNFTDKDLHAMKLYIEYIETALKELKKELEKIQVDGND